jgi:hypothetical protein
MKSRIPPKALLPLSVAGTLAALALVLGYLSYAGRPSRSLSQPLVFPGRAARPGAPVLPPAMVPRAAPLPRPATLPPQGTLPRPATLPQPATLPRPGVPGPSAAPGAMAHTPGAPGLTQTAGAPRGTGMAAQQPAPRPGLPLPPMSGVTTPAGKPPAATASAGGAPGASAEDAIVGTGPRGRGDPFSPLAVPESARPVPSTPSPSLPPPPGVGLPMPPGFGVPGGGTTPPPAPGAGMRVAGIMGSRSKVAIVESEGKTYIVGVGERVGDAVVVSIQADKVIMRQKGVTFELGFGGERSS